METLVVGMVNFGGGQKQLSGIASVALASGDFRVTVTAPQSILNEGETGILVVEIAPSLETLLSKSTANTLSEIVLNLNDVGVLTDGAQFLEVSAIVSDDSGLTFDEIDPARLLENPVQITVSGFGDPADGTESQFWFHNTEVETGTRIVAAEGTWLLVDGAVVAGDTLVADLTELSAFALIDVSLPVGEGEGASDGEPEGTSGGEGEEASDG